MAALDSIAEALAMIQRNKDAWCEAELYRLKGELLLIQNASNQIEAESHFRRALDISRQQNARSLELRAAMSLNKLREASGGQKAIEAQQILQEIYSGFKEGFDTADLRDAKVLLGKWGQSESCISMDEKELLHVYRSQQSHRTPLPGRDLQSEKAALPSRSHCLAREWRAANDLRR